MITMNETQAQRDAERIREHAPMLLSALLAMSKAACMRYAAMMEGAGIDDIMQAEHAQWQAEDEAAEAIEYATGAHDPDCYPEAGYEVDAAGTATGVSA